MPDIDRVKTVNVLRRIERRDDPARIDALRQWQLDEDAVDPLIDVQFRDQLEDIVVTGRGGQAKFERGDPRRSAGASLVADIDLARRILADEDRGETGG